MAPLVSLSSVPCPPFCSPAADRPAAPSSPVDMFGVPVIPTRRGEEELKSLFEWMVSLCVFSVDMFGVAEKEELN